MKLYNKLIKSILKGLNESGLFDDDLFDNNDELTLDELNIADNLDYLDYVDLGLPSGILWCTHNVGAIEPEDYGDYLTFDEAKEKYYSFLPSLSLFKELRTKCKWEWCVFNGIKGYKVIGPNGKFIFLPAPGYTRGHNDDKNKIWWFRKRGAYWTSELYDVTERYNMYSHAYSLFFDSKTIDPKKCLCRANKSSVRLYTTVNALNKNKN